MGLAPQTPHHRPQSKKTLPIWPGDGRFTQFRCGGVKRFFVMPWQRLHDARRYNTSSRLENVVKTSAGFSITTLIVTYIHCSWLTHVIRSSPAWWSSRAVWTGANIPVDPCCAKSISRYAWHHRTLIWNWKCFYINSTYYTKPDLFINFVTTVFIVRVYCCQNKNRVKSNVYL